MGLREAGQVIRLPLVEPMLAVAGPLPDGLGWFGEAKWDGARCLAFVEDGAVRLVGRRGTDFTERFPEVAGELAQVREPLLLDGELVVMRAGTPSFAALQGRIHRTRPVSVRAGATATPAVFVAFDVLHTTRSLLQEPYERRRGLLEGLGLAGPRLRVPPVWDRVGDAFAWTADHGLEGVVAKRGGSLYRPGARSRDWVKSKHTRTMDITIGGWLPGAGGDTVRAVLAGVPTHDGRLMFAGSVGVGFADAERRAMAVVLRRLAAPASPFTGSLGLPLGTELRFVRPELTAEVAFLELTDRGVMRQPVWRGLRGRAGPQRGE
ncbi:hypothetical protein [Kitasatospora sp. NPDC002965]|uniref:ATP-dependent DNA ligase n=1 Tax=Kitasatospora sp. NPDC002965 TaxID=3154775 RepID=UPI0033BDF526